VIAGKKYGLMHKYTPYRVKFVGSDINQEKAQSAEVPDTIYPSRIPTLKHLVSKTKGKARLNYIQLGKKSRDNSFYNTNN
jgi:hypothetical protein